MRRTIPALLVVLALPGCSLTLPVRGHMQHSDETFTGSATGHLDGGGSLVVKTTTGASCKGTFVYVTYRQGSGTFVCDDGRTGPFNFVSTGSTGAGTGDLGGQRFTFTFGGE